MPRKPLKRLEKRPEVEDWKIQILEDGLYPEGTGFEGLNFFYHDRYHDFKLDLYKSIRSEFLKKWIDENPCSRPWCWHQYDSPRQEDNDVNCFWHNTLPVERVHIGGGKRCKYNLVPSFYKGVFEYWHFSDDDLPTFESESVYLKRLDLLTEIEKKYLSGHPELLEPQSITEIIPGVTSEMYI